LKKPYPYQQDIINKTIEFKYNTLIQLPTGGGKTLISYEIAKELYSKYNNQILFIAPKINLMEQTLEAFKNSKPQKIHKNTPYDKKHPILISTIQTASRRDLNPDVIIIDEIHYGFDGKMIENLIKDKPNIRIIGLSATPYDKNGKLLQGFDLILNKYDMKYMIENKYLVPLKSYVLVKQNLSNVKLTAGDYNINQLSKVVSNNDTILEIVRTSKEFIKKSKKTIVFAVDINHCELLTEAFNKEGFTAKSLHSNNDKNELEVINDFKKGYIKVLVSVLKLTTGFDVPDTDLAIIARPTKSQNLYKQMVGRVLRKAENKKTSILLDCGNVIDELGNPLDSIKEKFVTEHSNKMVCQVCYSDRIKLQKTSEKVYWKCLDCGYIKNIESKNLYTCAGCGKKHNYKANFIHIQNKLFLKCECNSLTLISEYQGNEQFIELKSSKNGIKDNVASSGNIVQLLIDEEIRVSKAMNEFAKSIPPGKRILSLNNDIEKNKIFYDGLNKKQKDTLVLMLDKFFDICTNIKNTESMDSFVKNLNFNQNGFLLYFMTWSCQKRLDMKIDFDNAILEKLNRTLYENDLNYIIDNNILSLGIIISKTYELKLYDLMKLVIKKYNIINFNYSLSLYLSLSPEILENLFNTIDKTYIELLCPLIKTFDIGNCFSISDIFEDEDKIEKNLFYTIRFILNINEFLKKFNVEVLIFGKENKISYISYQKAKNFIRNLELKKLENWYAYSIDSNFHIEIPNNPNIIYNEQWESWDKWLDSKKSINKKTFDTFDNNEWMISDYLDSEDYVEYLRYQMDRYLPYEKAKKFIQSLNLKSFHEWEEYKKNSTFPNNIPKLPREYYHTLSLLSEKLIPSKKIQMWEDWNSWLGIKREKIKVKNNVQSERNNCYLSYNKAEKQIHALNIKSKKEWKTFTQDKNFPINIPKEPSIHYGNRGWKNYDIWLGLKPKEKIKRENFISISQKKTLNLVSIATKKYPNENVYFIQLTKNILDFYEKLNVQILSKNLKDDQIKLLKKKVLNIEEYAINKLKLFS
jgi:superfamily II DNA or RNA helicase